MPTSPGESFKNLEIKPEFRSRFEKECSEIQRELLSTATIILSVTGTLHPMVIIFSMENGNGRIHVIPFFQKLSGPALAESIKPIATQLNAIAFLLIFDGWARIGKNFDDAKSQERQECIFSLWRTTWNSSSASVRTYTRGNGGILLGDEHSNFPQLVSIFDNVLPNSIN